MPPFYFCADGTRTIQSQYAGGILLQPVQKLVATLIFARPTQGQKCKRVPSADVIIGTGERERVWHPLFWYTVRDSAKSGLRRAKLPCGQLNS